MTAYRYPCYGYELGMSCWIAMGHRFLCPDCASLAAMDRRLEASSDLVESDADGILQALIEMAIDTVASGTL